MSILLVVSRPNSSEVKCQIRAGNPIWTSFESSSKLSRKTPIFSATRPGNISNSNRYKLKTVGSKRITIRTEPDKPPPRDIQLLLTITFDESKNWPKESSTFAWKVITFKKNDTAKEKVTWYPGRNISRLVKDTFDPQCVSQRVERGHYIELREHGGWDIQKLHTSHNNQIIALNGTNSTARFVLGGTSVGDGNFQPYVVLKELGGMEGIVTELPCFLQVYEVTGISENRLIKEKLEGPLQDKDGKVCSLRLNKCGDDTCLCLHASEKAITLHIYAGGEN